MLRRCQCAPPLFAAVDSRRIACVVVSDGTGQKLACFYFAEEPGRRSPAKLLTRGLHATDSARNSLRQERKAK
jgi:hypothetical protein